MSPEDRFLVSGIDPGDDAWGTCTICGDYIWGDEVKEEEAFFEAFDPRPPHHNRCLVEFMRTGELLPQHMQYYQNPEEHFQEEYGISPEALNELHISAALRDQPIKRMTWNEVVSFLVERSIRKAS